MSLVTFYSAFIRPAGLIGARQEECVGGRGEGRGCPGTGPSHSWKLLVALLRIENSCKVLQGCGVVISAAAVKAADCLSPFLPAG